MTTPTPDPVSLSSESSPAASPAPQHVHRWRRVALWALLFLAGFGAGTAFTTMVAVRRVRQAITQPEQMPQRWAQRLRRQLRLSDEQAQEVRQILQTRHRRLTRIWREAYPQVRAELDATHDEVRAVLDPEQAERWDHLYRQYVGTVMPQPTMGPRRQGSPFSQEP